jgi:hypothetical protein
MQASVEACRVDVALCEKPYELPSPTIWSAKKPVICRLLSSLKSGLTVKIRNRMTRKILPLDLPSKRLGWDVRRRQIRRQMTQGGRLYFNELRLSVLPSDLPSKYFAW